MSVSFRFIRLLLVMVGVLFLVGCKDGASDNPTPIENSKGVFKNVSGINYITSSGIEGILDENGTFEYKLNDTIEFFVDDIVFGTLTAQKEITMFSFQNSTLIVQILYTLDSDSNPYNGIQVDTSMLKSQSNKYSKSLRTVEKINLDTLSEDSDKYKKIVTSYNLEPINKGEAIRTEMHIAIADATLKAQREYKYLVGDISIPSNTQYDIDIVKEAQKDINNRIKRFIYSTNFIKRRAALASKFSDDVANIEKNYNDFIQGTSEDMSALSTKLDLLAGLVKGEFFKTLAFTGAKNEVDEITKEIQNNLGEGTGANVAGALGGVLTACMDKNPTDADDVAECLININKENAKLFFKELYKNDPVYEGVSTGLTELAADNAEIYIKCKSLFTGGEVTDAGIGCISKVGTTLYTNVAKIVGSTNALYILANTAEELYSKDVAYALLEDLSYIGKFKDLASFLGADSEKIETLLEAKHQKMDYKDEAIDIKLALSTYTSIISKFNQEMNDFKRKSQYQKLFIKDESGKIIGITDSFRSAYIKDLMTLNIDGVHLLHENDKYYLDLCYTIKNNGIRDMNIVGKQISIFGASGDGDSIDISSIRDTITKAHPSNEKVYCNKYALNDYIPLTTNEEFAISVSFGIDNRSYSNTLDKSMVLKDYKIYDGVNIPFVSPMIVSIEKTKGDNPNEYKLYASFTNGDNFTSALDWRWTATGGNLLLDTSNTVTELWGSPYSNFTLIEDRGMVEINIFDISGNFLGSSQINIEKSDIADTTPLSVNNIYASINSGKTALLKPTITGGEAPYKVAFDVTNIKQENILKQTDNSILIRLESQKVLDTQNISYTVTDNLGNIAEAKAVIKVSNLKEDNVFPSTKWMDTATETMNWDDATQYCSDNGGRLPTIEELREEMTKCGGDTTNADVINNAVYQSCYNNNGFTNKYWSSTTYENRNDVAFFGSFPYSYAFVKDKLSTFSVRCITEEPTDGGSAGIGGSPVVLPEDDTNLP